MTTKQLAAALLAAFCAAAQSQAFSTHSAHLQAREGNASQEYQRTYACIKQGNETRGSSAYFNCFKAQQDISTTQEQAITDANADFIKEKPRKNRDFLDFVASYTRFDATQSSIFGECSQSSPKNPEIYSKKICKMVSYTPCPISNGACNITITAHDDSIQSAAFTLEYTPSAFDNITARIAKNLGRGSRTHKTINEIQMAQTTYEWRSGDKYGISITRFSGINIDKKPYDNILLVFLNKKVPREHFD